MAADESLPADCAATYRMVRRLGGGGFGAVYLAEHRELKRPVAIKLLLAEILGDAEQVARFDDEARITARLSHPHVIRVLDHGAREGVPWIAYEYIEGATVRWLLERGGLPLEKAVAAVSQVAAALEAAHALGIVHRDVKPDNVMEAGEGLFKLGDFGVARAAGRRVQTEDGTILGTPAYLAPEMVRGAAPSVASDVYALGVTLFELVTGQLPFSNPTPVGMFRMHLDAPVPWPSQVRPELPAGLDAVVKRALAKAPADRFASARALGEALAALKLAPDAWVPFARVETLAVARGAAGARRSRPGAVVARPTAAPARPQRARVLAAGAALVASLVLAAWRARPEAPVVPLASATAASSASASAPRASAAPPVVGPELTAQLLECVALFGRVRARGSALARQFDRAPDIFDPGVRAELARLRVNLEVARRALPDQVMALRRDLRVAIERTVVLVTRAPGGDATVLAAVYAAFHDAETALFLLDDPTGREALERAATGAFAVQDRWVLHAWRTCRLRFGYREEDRLQSARAALADFGAPRDAAGRAIRARLRIEVASALESLKHFAEACSEGRLALAEARENSVPATSDEVVELEEQVRKSCGKH